MQTELNKALSEIYSDLEKLQSARNQVQIVTDSSKELTMATSNLLKELRIFSNQFGEDNSSNLFQLTKSLNDFEDKINEISKKGNESIDNQIVYFKKQIDEHIIVFKQTTEDLKINTEKGIEEIKTVAIVKIENQEQIITKTIECIEKTNTKANELIDIITNYDIPNSLEMINQKLDTQLKASKLNKVLLIATLSLLGIVGTMTIVLLMKFL
jgi:hypothetical protein